VIFTLVFATFGRPVWPAVVGRVADGSPAAAAGLKTGDIGVEVDGRPVMYWEDLERTLGESGGRPLTVRVKRGNAEQTVTITPRRKTTTDPIFGERREVWDIGAGPQLIPQISSVLPDSPAQQAACRPATSCSPWPGSPSTRPRISSRPSARGPVSRCPSPSSATARSCRSRSRRAR